MSLETPMDPKRNDVNKPAPTPRRRAWVKPSLRIHGDLATLTRAKNPNGLDSGLGTQIS